MVYTIVVNYIADSSYFIIRNIYNILFGYCDANHISLLEKEINHGLF